MSETLKRRRWVLFPPTYRLIALCLGIGVLGAVAALLFDLLVDLAQKYLLEGLGGYVPPAVGTLAPISIEPDLASRWWIPLVTTLGGVLSGWVVYYFAPEAEGHGTDAAIGSYHQKGGQVRARVPFVKAVASALTIGSGGVAGREGPTAQISAGLGAYLSRRMKLRGQQRRILLLASVAAGLAAIFQAPLGMAIFAVEVLYAGMIFESEALIYTVISAVTAYAIHGFFAGWSPIFAIPDGLVFDRPETLLGYALLGVMAGFFGAVLPTIFYGIRDLFRLIPGPPHLKPALGGLCVGLLGMAFPPVLGTGYGWVELAIAGQLSLMVLLTLMLLKGPAMALTIGSGGSGGVFGPTVVMGAMLGGVVALVLNGLFPVLELKVAAFVLVGMAATFAGAARTPISTIIMVAEMTGGYTMIVPTMLSTILAFLVQRSATAGWKYPRLYVSQVEGREDSPVHRGVFVRRALRMLEHGLVDAGDVTLPRLVSLLQFGEPIQVVGSDVLLIGIRIDPGSELAGQTVADGIGSIQGATAVAILRGQEMIVPRGPDSLEAGDQMIAVATSEAFGKLKSLAFGSQT